MLWHGSSIKAGLALLNKHFRRAVDLPRCHRWRLNGRTFASDRGDRVAKIVKRADFWPFSILEPHDRGSFVLRQIRGAAQAHPSAIGITRKNYFVCRRNSDTDIPRKNQERPASMRQ